MKIAVLRERADGETRVAATPETVTKLIGLGAEVAIEAGAGELARFPDADYQKAGASVGNAAATIKGADIVLTVRRPAAVSLAGAAAGALVIGAMDPYGNEGEIAALAKAGVTAVAMEFMPRITRAQVMDILSSQANLAGYQAVIDAAGAFDRAMPMMMTAAGTVRPAKVFVMGAGVAGLQAIATAKRLGAVVTATDVRAAAGEQVESLGAKFIMTDALKDASGTGGYARELTKDEQAAQAELVAGHIAKQDIVITTALIPGRPAPKLVSRVMVESMAPGSVLVDLAAERGGNIELTQPGKTITTANGATIIGFTNVAGRLATSASQLYSRNLVSFLETLIDKKEKVLAVNWDDELVKATVLTRDGAIVHPNIKFEAAPAATKPAAKVAEPAKTAATGKAAAPKKAAVAKAEPVPAPAPAKTAAVAKPAAPKKAAAKAEAKPAAAKPAAKAAAKPAAAKASTAKGKK
ncbi:MAG TPA: Re/Si-specific NAD(P)(+) transhydrogenase subunit alpha [Devosia sp.]|jgi:NAD(P) transhydrogenase subunit alpha|uniref:Re/Si-specific NAD(P)(+) transhydrogenase subunit alpha n=1 Tax=Devosia sp. TaxID=1871048 RepID=UPI002DDD92A7|nr:Re/Si-specific NAD(P)(+) transhydrogenase subunit alpha [Devosia sp.]HEV2514377.1 Re/Si-specific NAD(P)(+) transhydrogenase subunit alpha [Devosia sp.]